MKFTILYRALKAKLNLGINGRNYYELPFSFTIGTDLNDGV